MARIPSLLPLVAIVVGAVLLAFYARDTVSMFFAGMLVSCGILFLAQRFKQSREEALTQFAESESGLVRLSWREEFRCGHPQIDEQHRNLFKLGNQLIHAVMMQEGRQQVEKCLDRLVQDIEDHFATEEIVLTRWRIASTETHRAIHRELLDRARFLRDNHAMGQVPVGDLVGFIAYDMVAEHILKEDLKFGPDGQPVKA